ncbi:hypothetical protein BJ508DRAFT_315362 [Ascobolus immersus RN42]|uniref:DUF1772-domain-containing protein n=1 Tax=Ascobolus immersus RN42 TaxID=1160509 RepID=A0A3N4HDM3_ASCIM|nr:hypothetical protein BJ508DRAFT_315362 [Ascobolus immersus RN42]
MAHCVGGTLKLGGIFTLGLLAGTEILSVASIRSILSLPSSKSAQSPLTSLHTSLTTLTRPLSIFTSAALITAYILAPPRGKHPYLLLCSAFPIFGLGIDALLVKKVKPVLQAEEVNGEVVRESVVKYGWGQAVNATLSVVGFGMSVVGIWGDGA